jgi:hypothetical protein
MNEPNPNLDRTQQTADNIAANRIAADTARPLADREVPQQRYEAPADTANERTALFEAAVLNEFNSRWSEVQTGFVDEPRRAVQQADALVSDVINRIADSFGRERAQLEQQWDRGDNVSTEHLRVALQRYRWLFSRLLTICSAVAGYSARFPRRVADLTLRFSYIVRLFQQNDRRRPSCCRNEATHGGQGCCRSHHER